MPAINSRQTARKFNFAEVATQPWAGKKLVEMPLSFDDEDFSLDRSEFPDVDLDKDDRYEEH
jgi:hypothetical protein